MASFTVDTAQVASSAGDVSRISEDVETTVASMMTRLISLQNEWQGEASSSFQDLINDWRATQRTVKESLDEIGRVLGEAGRTYDDTENSVKSTMRPGRLLMT